MTAVTRRELRSAERDWRASPRSHGRPGAPPPRRRGNALKAAFAALALVAAVQIFGHSFAREVPHEQHHAGAQKDEH